MNTRIFNIMKGSALILAVTLLAAACQPQIAAAPPVATTAPSAVPSASVSSATPPVATEAPTAVSSGSASINVSSNAALGSFLVDQNGMTLYIFMKDTAGVSNCAGSCATNWPPLTVASASALPTEGSGVAGMLAAITRSDGSIQVTYNGMPLYYFAGDKAAGDTNGQGIGGNWFVAPPTASSAPMMSATPTTPPSAGGSGGSGGYGGYSY